LSSALPRVPFCDRMRTYTQIVNGGQLDVIDPYVHVFACTYRSIRHLPSRSMQCTQSLPSIWTKPDSLDVSIVSSANGPRTNFATPER